MSKQFYITTAIDYPNGAPHMGHAYEKIITDTYARWYRWMGYDTYFLTGTDENGQKLAKTAEAARVDTRKFVDEQSEVFRQLCKDLHLSNDDFIRTTEPRHIAVAQKLWRILEEKGDIYEGEYSGLYCLNCEAFYTDLQADDGKCPNHGTALEEIKEKGFFFRLSSYADWIEKHIEQHAQFVAPDNARKEILNRIKKDKVRDISVSRPNTGWGIPIPGHEDFVMYTWFDALINYLSAVLAKEETQKFWPAQCHVIGKDIVWFHCVIWPCMLHAADWKQPEQVYVHGMVLGEDGRKMSKSVGNGIDPYEVLKKYPIDSFRYYLLRAIPSGLDGAFVLADLEKRHNHELANDYGNLLMRVVKLAMKKRGSDFSAESVTKAFDFSGLATGVHGLMEKREHHRAIDLIWEKVNEVNLYLNEKEPWKVDAQTDDFKSIIYNSLYALYCLAGVLSAFMPGVSEKTLAVLGAGESNPSDFNFGAHSFKLTTPEPLFPKFE